MKKSMIFLLKALIGIAIIVVVYFVVSILYAMITDYKPDKMSNAETKQAKHPASDTVDVKDTLTLFSWNIGYAGLGKESDFFYDGGKMVRPAKHISQKNLSGILDQIAQFDAVHADFILLQEVDICSNRSYHTNQWEKIAQILPQYNSSFGKNYDVKYIPIPPLEPMGKALGGIITFYKAKPLSAPLRYSFPANFSFPKGLFFLDRCFTLQRFAHGDKELVLINTHNSAYDGGTLKKEEMAYFHDYLTAEYAKGNYVIVGGDWNQIPPGYVPLLPAGESGYEETPIPQGYLPPEWTWAYDGSTATNRKVDFPYQKGKTYTTVIDYFLLSPNIELIKVKGIANGFEHSDHQPVWTQVRLK